MKRKYIDESWYILFDGTSYYGVLGMDTAREIIENGYIVVSGPHKDYPEDTIEQLNIVANGNI